MSKHTGLYPGTFDPITRGHIDIISRAIKVVDKLIVAVAANPGKGPMFTLDERLAQVSEAVRTLPHTRGVPIEVIKFQNLLMNCAVAHGASVIIRGLRAVSDFEYEFQMTGMNAHLNPEVETLFLMASEGTQFISSRFVKEICVLGGDISKFVPAHVRDALQAKVAARDIAAD